METYDGPLPAGITLKDATQDINAKVNAALKAPKEKTAGKSPALENEVYKALGLPVLPYLQYAPIESWANALPRASAGAQGTIYQPKVEDSQYRDTSTAIRVGGLAPVMLVGDVLFGVDKIGHFFQLGYANYYKLTQGAAKLSPADAATEGDKTEVGLYGLQTTGVYSNADLAANRAGMKFYQEIAASPSLLFDIRKYVSDKWNEQNNLNLYDNGITHTLMRNNIPGRWSGTMSWRDGSTSEVAGVNAEMDVTGARTMDELGKGLQHITGKYQYKHPRAGFTSGELEGTMTHTKNADGAIVRTDMDVNWKEGGASGRGSLVLSGLRMMSGRWGRAASKDDGGDWRFTKAG